ncbi:MAG: gliding motility-associated C-terminal domain-containing protein [Lewinellaceae bacterium]|nr:gliding motility-associated C-terminal domain-containing protein [Lewinellaceae bacterium]
MIRYPFLTQATVRLTALGVLALASCFLTAGKLPENKNGTFFVTGGCSGSLGENIFTDGDFGSGAATILQTDPHIAPGYIYTTSTPPSDGYYVLTNNTGAWSNIYSSWVRIRDNSSDPNGYMMVVNASYAPGIFYEQTISGLCTNTLYEFSADVINMVKTGVTNHIFPDISFLINDVVFFSSGGISQDEKWHTFGFTFTTGPDENTVKLSIRNNAPGGGGNDLALDNISFRACGPTAIAGPETHQYYCTGSVVDLEAQVLNSSLNEHHYQWQLSADNGQTWTDIQGATHATENLPGLQEGRYLFRFFLAGSAANLQNTKCRVVSSLHEIEVLPVRFMETDTICEGATYALGGSVYDRTGVYTQNLISSRGCDSIVELHLTVVEDPGIEASIKVEQPFCPGDENGSIAFQLTTPGNGPYRYFLNDQVVQAPGIIEGLSAGSYNLVIEDRFGCRLEEFIPVEDPSPVELELGPDTAVVLGGSVRLRPYTGQQGLTYAWQGASGLSCLDCPAQEVSPVNATVYTLKVTDNRGCSAVDSVRVGVIKDYRIFVPNAFSPNGDGINDRLNAFSDGFQVDRIALMQVFDRWGALVYEGKDLAPDAAGAGWDGKSSGRYEQEGVYVYRMQIVFIDGAEREFTGSVSLIR